MDKPVVKDNFNRNSSSENYFGLKIRNKNYPSSYQYNIVIMLAKRLIDEENNTINPCTSGFKKHFN